MGHKVGQSSVGTHGALVCDCSCYFLETLVKNSGARITCCLTAVYDAPAVLRSQRLQVRVVPERLSASAVRVPAKARCKGLSYLYTQLFWQKWVTKWVSRHVVRTCKWLVSNLLTTCGPRFDPEKGP